MPCGTSGGLRERDPEPRIADAESRSLFKLDNHLIRQRYTNGKPPPMGRFSHVCR